jgi:uncharacterized membrane protein YbhN (UPF0104 family)
MVILAKLVVSAGLLGWLLSRVDATLFWATARRASPDWLLVALVLYVLQLFVAAWRWKLLLGTQRVPTRWHSLVGSYTVAFFFNNFLPSNIGGDVIRIGDTAGPAGSKTLATTVVLFDRVIGLLGLMLVAALGATIGAAVTSALPVWPSVLWASFGLAAVVSIPAVVSPLAVRRLLQPLRVFHATWVEDHIAQVTEALGRFRQAPGALAACFGGAIAVQAILVAFYIAIAHSMHIPVPAWDLAVIVPVSFVVQMLPISVNGFGVREATFWFCFARLGLPRESAIVVSFMGAALMMLFSLSGAAVYVARGTRRRHAVLPCQPDAELSPASRQEGQLEQA